MMNLMFTFSLDFEFELLNKEPNPEECDATEV